MYNPFVVANGCICGVVMRHSEKDGASERSNMLPITVDDDAMRGKWRSANRDHITPHAEHTHKEARKSEKRQFVMSMNNSNMLSCVACLVFALCSDVMRCMNAHRLRLPGSNQSQCCASAPSSPCRSTRHGRYERRSCGAAFYWCGFVFVSVCECACRLVWCVWMDVDPTGTDQIADTDSTTRKGADKGWRGRGGALAAGHGCRRVCL